MGCWLSFPPSQVCLSQPLDQDGSQALEVQKIIRSMREELGLEPFGDLEPYSQRECPTQVNRFFWLWVDFFCPKTARLLAKGFLIFFCSMLFNPSSQNQALLLSYLSISRLFLCFIFYLCRYLSTLLSCIQI